MLAHHGLDFWALDEGVETWPRDFHDIDVRSAAPTHAQAFDSLDDGDTPAVVNTTVDDAETTLDAVHQRAVIKRSTLDHQEVFLAPRKGWCGGLHVNAAATIGSADEAQRQSLHGFSSAQCLAYFVGHEGMGNTIGFLSRWIGVAILDVNDTAMNNQGRFPDEIAKVLLSIHCIVCINLESGR